MGKVFLLSLTAALNPTLIAASTVMLLLDHPKKLMLGYLLGALMTGITLGLVIVFALKKSGAVSTTQHGVSPGIDLALGALALVGASVLGTGRDQRLRERRRRHKDPDKAKKTPRWQQALNKGSARTTFLVGMLLSFPGASYLAGLTQLEKQKTTPAVTVLVVIALNLIMLMLLELPLIGFALAPEWTPKAIERAKVWVGRRGRHYAVIGLALLGSLLVIRGVLGLVS